MIVQACLNGARPPEFHQRLPATPEAIVADAVAAIDAGANELHIHIRGNDHVETLAPAAVDRTIALLRERLPGTLIGISTGAWIERDDARRLRFIDEWRQLPDYASVNFGEEDAPAVFERLVRRGIGVESGLATVADTERYLNLGLAGSSLRILIEIEEQEMTKAEALADAMLLRLAEAGVRKPILLHGADDTVWPFVKRAAGERYSTRVGLEDGGTLPGGRKAASNADIVAAAVAIMWKGG